MFSIYEEMDKAMNIKQFLALSNLEKNISFKEESSKDKEFLLSLYASTREEELSYTTMSQIEKKIFINMQFDLKQSYYKKNYKDAEFLILKRKKQDIGRIVVDEREDHIHLVDIAIIKKMRSKGLGSFILKQLIENTNSKNKLFTLSVSLDNYKAISLYKKLGLHIVKTQNHYHQMQTSIKEVIDRE